MMTIPIEESKSVHQVVRYNHYLAVVIRCDYCDFKAEQTWWDLQ